MLHIYLWFQRLETLFGRESPGVLGGELASSATMASATARFAGMMMQGVPKAVIAFERGQGSCCNELRNSDLLKATYQSHPVSLVPAQVG